MFSGLDYPWYVLCHLMMRFVVTCLLSCRREQRFPGLKSKLERQRNPACSSGLPNACIAEKALQREFQVLKQNIGLSLR